MLDLKHKALTRPRRSLLFMPGIHTRALEKAKTLPADVLIFDLEDAVQPESKPEARARVLEAINTGNYGHREKVVRINSLSSEWGEEDLRAFATSKADAILMSKVERVDEVTKALMLIDHATNHSKQIPIWCMIETPLGVINAHEIAATHYQVQAFVTGTSDLSYTLGSIQTPDRMALLHSLSKIIISARAHGLLVFDGVYIDLDDMEGLKKECEQGMTLGFDGKSLIHPKMLEIANKVFTPTTRQIKQAEKIVAAFEAAQAEQKALTVVDGRLVERLHYNHAVSIITLAKQIAERDKLYTSAA